MACSYPIVFSCSKTKHAPSPRLGGEKFLGPENEKCGSSRSSRMTKSHDTISHQRVDLGGTESKLNENFPRLCAEPLWRKSGLRCLAVITHRMIDKRDRCSGFAASGHRDQRLRMGNLRIGEDGRIVLDRRVPDFGLLEQGEPGLRGFLFECGRD